MFGILWQVTSGDLATKVRTARFDSSGAIVSFEGVDGPPQPYYEAQRDKLRTQAIAANTLWVTGAVLTAGGVVLYLLGRDSAD